MLVGDYKKKDMLDIDYLTHMKILTASSVPVLIPRLQRWLSTHIAILDQGSMFPNRPILAYDQHASNRVVTIGMNMKITQDIEMLRGRKCICDCINGEPSMVPLPTIMKHPSKPFASSSK